MILRVSGWKRILKNVQNATKLIERREQKSEFRSRMIDTSRTLNMEDGVPEINAYLEAVSPNLEEMGYFKKELLKVTVDVTEWLQRVHNCG